MVETIETMRDVSEVICQNSSGPGREWDCKVNKEFGKNAGQMGEYYIDEFTFRSTNRSKGTKSKGEKVVSRFSGGVCQLEDINGLVSLSCE